MADRTEDPVPAEVDLIVTGAHGDPHRILGRHGKVVRTFRPGAGAVQIVVGDQRTPMKLTHPAGLWEGPIAASVDDYQLAATYGEVTHTFADPYRSWPTLGELDLHLFGEGRHRRLWDVLGAHPRVHQGSPGVSFAVWAPNAQAVRVVGDWNHWDGRVHTMRSLGSSGVWELFIPGVEAGARYKYELIGADGRLFLKADPMAFATQVPPDTASMVAAPATHEWQDATWIDDRARGDLLREPVSMYELHLGSWRWIDDGHGGRRPMTYLELADTLPDYVASLGFTHIELMPIAEHPFAGSWGYQVSAYYAPTSRFGSPDDLRVLVDACHRKGLGVIVDWVPAHFPRDEFALARFDGTALYEHDDPRLGAHPDWGTLVFNFGRNEVRNFLVANALYWIEEFHIDGLRVDAVASMLYLDYSRRAGEWIPNAYGGRENLDAVALLKEVNEAVYGTHPGTTMIAEESTAWPGVSRPTYLGGLGFGFKWNMGWMHDTLEYFSHDPIHRRFHQHDLTFGLIYAWSENFVLPLSHDEMVHGKGSLLNKMPGDRWQQLANLRALYAWMWAHPGKKMLFMGAELAPEGEWSHERELDWWILDHWDSHRQVKDLLSDLNRIYRENSALWRDDSVAAGFQWIDAGDNESSVLSFLRWDRPAAGAAGLDPSVPTWPAAELPPATSVLACIANLTPIPRHGYRVGLPLEGRWTELLNTDAREWGGSGVGNGGAVQAEHQPWHGQPYSAEMVLPPLSVLWLRPEEPAGG